MTVLVSIGNSDDKLTQSQWNRFWRDVDNSIRARSLVVHGAWVSESVSEYQNAAWCFEPLSSDGDDRSVTGILKTRLVFLAEKYGQDSIAWMEGETEMLPGRPVEPIPIKQGKSL